MIEEEILIKIIASLLVAFFFVFRSRFTKHYKMFTYNTLIKWFILAALAIFYLSGSFDGFALNFSFYIRILTGIPIILLGFSLLFWAHFNLRNNWSPIIEKKFTKSRKLITTGPYRYLRHPIYSASFISLIGFFILTANWLLAAIPFFILLFFYIYKIPREEKELLDNFGAKYKRYMKRTGGLFPKI